jgi:spore maturation protein CgeB
MFFGIPGVGSCQLAEENSHLQRWLNPGVDYVEFADENFLSTLTSMLVGDVDARSVAISGHAKAVECHTYKNRIKKILEVVGVSQ